MECIEQIKKHIIANELEKALQLIAENDTQYDHDAEFLKVKAMLCIKAAEFDTAIAILKQAEMISPVDADIFKELSYCYKQKANCFFEEESTDNITIINSDKVESVIFEDHLNIYKNREAARQLLREKDDPLVSIYFLAYNNLEKYTKPAIECLLKYTQDIDYELLLVDNGSIDGTFEYFKSLNIPRKRIYRITTNRGVGYAGTAIIEHTKGCYYKGKYWVGVPNDVFVTPNWLKNMLACMEADETVGMAVPMSDYISNDQKAAIEFESLEEMQEKAALYNISDPLKWEERLRVIPTAFIVRKSANLLHGPDGAFSYYFADDDASFKFRRAGYKLIVCGDVFVHHAGTTAAANSQAEYAAQLKKARGVFRDFYHGIDAWEDISYEWELIDGLLDKPNVKLRNKMLGIDVRCGAALLQMKNGLRKHGAELELSAYIRDAKYWLDLKCICNGDVFCGDLDRIQHKIENTTYDYILIGEFVDSYGEAWPKLIDSLLECLGINGRLAFKMRAMSDDKFAAIDLQQLQQMKSTKNIQLRNEEVLGMYLQKRKNNIVSTNSTVRDIDVETIGELEASLRKNGLDEHTVRHMKENCLHFRKQYIIVLAKKEQL